jgi:hypothetical protein
MKLMEYPIELRYIDILEWEFGVGWTLYTLQKKPSFGSIKGDHIWCDLEVFGSSLEP